MNTNNEDQHMVTRALGELRARASSDSKGRPLPDVDELLASAKASQPRPDGGARGLGRQSRFAAAAALVVVAAGALLFVIQPRAPQAAPESEPLVSLVDSLYDEPDYMDGVWSSVLDELESTP